MGVFGFDLTDPALYESGFPHRIFSGIRHDCRVAWHDPTGSGPVTDGFWSVAGHGDVTTVLARTEIVSGPPASLIDDAVGLALLELARRPQLLARTRALGVDAAAPELARWVCPQIVVWCRARDEFALDRHRVAPGERLACWLPSANRDEAVYGRTAMDLVLERTPNPHLTWAQIPSGSERFASALSAALDRPGDPIVTDEPEWVRSAERSALVTVPVAFVTEPAPLRQ